MLLKAISFFLVLACLLAGCSSKSPDQPTKQPATSPALTLGPYPKGGNPGPWIPPVPEGMKKPSKLSQKEWDTVIDIANKDAEVVRQVERNNIKEAIHFWVGYAGGPGYYADSDAAIIEGADSAVMTGKAQLPPEDLWYYPAIKFEYRLRTDRSGQTVGVDIKTEKIIFSGGVGFELPPKRPY